jgi:hypothetical protein
VTAGTAVTTEITPGLPGTTSSVTGPFDTSFPAVYVQWDSSGLVHDTQQPQILLAMIPGDTVQVPLTVGMVTTDGSSYVGTVQIRYEFVVTVPEPSTALSLPIGVLGLAGLAAVHRRF